VNRRALNFEAPPPPDLQALLQLLRADDRS
jgi:hypothetical protein